LVNGGLEARPGKQHGGKAAQMNAAPHSLRPDEDLDFR
jgi:hypothetical protein